MKTKVFIVFLYMLCTGCKTPSEPEKHIVEDILSEFVSLKYAGKFRTDTLFNKTINARLKMVTESDNDSLAESLLQIQTEWNLIKGDSTLARKKLDRLAAGKYSKSGDSYNWLVAYYESNRENYGQGITGLNGILKKADTDPTFVLKSHWLLGSVYENTNRDSLAILHYKKAKEVGPLKNNADYYLESVFHLGNMFYKNNRPEEAEKEYELALEVSEKFNVQRLIPFGFYHLGKMDEKRGDYKKALEKYGKAQDYILKTLKEPGHFMNNFLDGKIKSLEGK